MTHEKVLISLRIKEVKIKAKQDDFLPLKLINIE